MQGIRLLKRDLIQAFGEQRIISFLYYGSHAFNRKTSPYSDYDFYLLLDSLHTDDFKKIREISLRTEVIDLTVQYLDRIEQKGWDNFQLGNHGIFFLFHLSSAITIIGNNMFRRKIFTLSKEKVRESLLMQIEEYFWRLDHWYLTIRDEEWVIIQYKKYLLRICQDILLLKGDISFEEINTLNPKDTINNHIVNKSYFSRKTIELIPKALLLKNSLTALLKTHQCLYEDYLKVYKHGL